MFYNIKKILKNIWYLKSLLYLCGVKERERVPEITTSIYHFIY